MMRGLFLCGLLCWMTGVTFADDVEQGRSDNDALRVDFDEQFVKLDANRDGKLDPQELSKLPSDDLAKMRKHGLKEKSPASRAEFSAARMAIVASEAVAAAETAKVAGADETQESTPTRDDDGPEPADSKTNSPPDEKSSSATASRDDDAVEPVPATTSTKETESGTPVKAPSLPTALEAGTPRASRANLKKTHFVPELPAEYAARDKNGDGQIGLYEWDRKKYAEFAKLDKNGDGFLTPAELLPKGTLKNLYASASNSAASSGGKGSVERKPGEDGTEQEARNTFGQLDGDKDGMVDESEWGRSRRTRSSFESASVQVSLPMNADTFVALFRQVKESSGRGESR